MRKNYVLSKELRFFREMVRPGSRSLSMILGVAFTLFVSVISNAQVTTNGGSGLNTTYADLATAISALNSATITSPVVISIGGNQSAPASGYIISAQGSAANTITIKPDTGVTATISGSTTAAIFKLNGADYVIIDGSNNGTGSKDLTIINNNTNIVSAVVWLASASASNGATNNTVKNCILTGNDDTTTRAAISVSGTGTTTNASTANSGNRFQNNTMSLVKNGIEIFGPTALQSGTVISGNTIGTAPSTLGISGISVTNDTGTLIDSNAIQGVLGSTSLTSNTYVGGILLLSATGASGAVISNNTINDIKSQVNATAGYSVAGINSTAGFVNCTISGNTITGVANTSANAYGARGVTLLGNGTVFANNMISDVYSSQGTSLGNNGQIGIVVGASAANVGLYHNTVHLYGPHTGNAANTTSGISTCVFVGTSGTGIDIRNNILVNTYDNTTSTGDKSYAVYSSAANTAQFSTINYNDYFVGGSGSPVLGYLSSDRITLADMIAGFGGNANSINVSPVFTSNTDLHLVPASNTYLDNLGTQIVTVTTDIDGQTRNVSTPDMGADEFASSVCSAAVGGSSVPAVATLCVSGSTTVSATGFTVAGGITYQWESSADAAFTSPVNEGVSTSVYANLTTPVISATTYYRLKVTCSAGMSDYSTVSTVTVTTSVTPTFTQVAAICSGAALSALPVTSDNGVAGTWTPALNNTTTTTYTFTPTAGQCATNATMTITVNGTAQPTASSQTFCNAATVADLVAAGTAIQWYAGPSGGSALASADALSTGTYYVTQTIAGCESTRLAISVTVNVTAAPTGAGSQAFVSGQTIANIAVTGSNVVWYPTALDAANGTNALASTTLVVNNTTYYATQTVGGCTSTTSLAVLASVASPAQVTTNSGSGLNPTYSDLATAITALNAAAITSPVVITLNGNETAPAGGYVITASGTSVNTIIIQGGAHAITASGNLTAGNLNDAIFKFVGADYVTLQGFTMMENVANTVTTAASNNMTEWGVALLYTSVTDGCKNITIQNNTIDLDRTYQNTFGIYSNSTHSDSAVTTSATATATDGGNHNLRIYGNTITDANIAIAVVGPIGVADQNDGLDIGGNGLATGNTITNYGTTSAFSAYANVTASTTGILVRNTKNYNVSYNTVTSSNGGVTSGALRGIYVTAFNSAPTGVIVNSINNNTISVRSAAPSGAINSVVVENTTSNATTTLNINNNDFSSSGHTVASSAIVAFISNAAPALLTNINGNTFSNISLNTSGAVTFIANSVTRPDNAVCNVNNNAIVGTFSKTVSGGITAFYQSNGTTPNSATEINTGNNFSNVTSAGGTFSGWASTDGTAKTVSNNVFNNITISGGTSPATILNVSNSSNVIGGTVSNNTITNIVAPATLIGMSSNGGAQFFAGNNINGLTSNGATSQVSAMSFTGGTQRASKNKIYNISTSTAGGSVNGINISGGITTINNNIIGDLKANIANAANPIRGINITGGVTVDIYYNTIRLEAASTGALFGSSVINSTAPATTITLQNNILINNSAVAGAGLAAVYRRSSTVLSGYGSASDNNLYYGSTLFTDGTNTDVTLAQYKARVAPRDASSVTENPSFISTTGSDAQFLHINTVNPTLVEGRAIPIANFTDDFDGDVRNATTPDIGADEFAGTPIATVKINTVGTTPLGNQCTAVSRTVTANVTAGMNDITSVTLNYSFNGVAQTPVAMTGGTLTTGTTSAFSGVIPVAIPTNATVTWSVTAVDPLDSKNVVGTSYQDEPLLGVTAAANASATSLCASATSVLSANLTRVGNVTIGTSNNLTADTEDLTAFNNKRSSYQVQLLYTAAELSAAGLTSGPINSLAFNINTLGSSASNTMYMVKIGSTSLNALTGFVATTGFTTVFPAADYTHAVGLNVINFSTPYVWDGTSNIIIDVMHNGISSANNAQTYYTPTTGVNTVVYAFNGSGTGTLSDKRFNLVLNGETSPAVTNYSWSDGSTVVGTGNNLSVSPTVTTTYTATLSAAGCTIATNSVTVTVNTVAAPTGASTQVVSVPVATDATIEDIIVTGSNIIWYPTAADAAAGTNALPAGTQLVSGSVYYATQTVGGCTSTTSLAVTITVTLGVKDFEFANLKLYPNPVTNVLTIENGQDISSVEIYNVIGQKVVVKTVNAVSTVVDMSSLAGGTYLVKVASDNAVKTIKVIKK